MFSNQEIANKPRPSGGATATATAAVKESSRILSSVFLSLLLPLSFLLLARLSIASYFVSITNHTIINNPQIIIIFSTLALLVFLVTVAALAHCSTGRNAALLIGERRRLCAGWVVLFLTQCCLILGIPGTIDAEINGYRTEGSLNLSRRLFFALGLHGTTIFWLGNVVRPVVDVTIFGCSGEGSTSWTEKLILAAAFGNLWWRSLREEAEALVLLPRDGVAGSLGHWLYYLTAAVGAVGMVNGFSRVVRWVCRRCGPIKIDKNVDDCAFQYTLI